MISMIARKQPRGGCVLPYPSRPPAVAPGPSWPAGTLALPWAGTLAPVPWAGTPNPAARHDPGDARAIRPCVLGPRRQPRCPLGGRALGAPAGAAATGGRLAHG